MKAQNLRLPTLILATLMLLVAALACNLPQTGSPGGPPDTVTPYRPGGDATELPTTEPDPPEEPLEDPPGELEADSKEEPNQSSGPEPEGEAAEDLGDRSLDWVQGKVMEVQARIDPTSSAVEHVEVVYEVLRSVEPAPLEVVRRVMARVRPLAIRHLESYLRRLVEAGRIAYVSRGQRYVVVEQDARSR